VIAPLCFIFGAPIIGMITSYFLSAITLNICNA